MPMSSNTHTGLRIGIGHDRHRLESGGPLRIGGVEIPFDQNLVGHSDADVLLHAITDAILGAASLGDIGEMFPNTDEENRNRDSIEMLSNAAGLVVQSGYAIVNIDCILFAERPKLSGYKLAIRQRIAETLSLDPECVGIKAKTGEQVGLVGQGQVLEAQCVALLIKT